MPSYSLKPTLESTLAVREKFVYDKYVNKMFCKKQAHQPEI